MGFVFLLQEQNGRLAGCFLNKNKFSVENVERYIYGFLEVSISSSRDRTSLTEIKLHKKCRYF